MIQKDFQPTPEMHARAVHEIGGFVRSSRMIPLFWLGIAITAALLGLIRLSESPGQFPGSAARLFALACAAVLFQFVLKPRLTRKKVADMMKKAPSASAHQHYEISSEGIRNHGDGFDTQLAWSALTKVRVSRTFVLFFLSPRSAFFVPKELFAAGELQQVLQWGER